RARTRDRHGAVRVAHLPPRPSRRGRGVPRAPLDLAISIGESSAIAAPGSAAAAAGQIGAQLETGEAVRDVLGEARLRVFAVAGDVDAALGLHPHGVGHVSGQDGALGVAERCAVLLTLEDLHHLPRSHETPNVGRKDATTATLHWPLSCAVRLRPPRCSAPEVGGLDLIALQQRLTRSRQYDRPGFDHVPPVGALQRLSSVLLYEQDRAL